ncbi:uncharacterized protein N7500_000029 [Penicillium coprophilum]|uniref:uncharacterized protein n=1 Tax=Penicillium coprophilum TaxID=36646 RepID=UPI0023955B14|nr:uncharacterized protein N7500_000029 [Penicillium coprophilum]KAJ5177330.1 hypothetical protein N7500_000029 [Penicillium coprophilum]
MSTDPFSQPGEYAVQGKESHTGFIGQSSTPEHSIGQSGFGYTSGLYQWISLSKLDVPVMERMDVLATDYGVRHTVV